MSQDAISEIISHFIGHFHLILEEARARELFETLSAATRDPVVVPLSLDEGLRTPTLALLDYDPELFTPVFAVPSPVLQHVAASWASPMFFNDVVGAIPPYPATVVPPPPPAEVPGMAIFVLPPPGSVATVTFQSNILIDNDLFQTDPAVQTAWLEAAVTQAGLTLAQLDAVVGGLMDVSSVSATPAELVRETADHIRALRVDSTETTVALMSDQPDLRLVDGAWNDATLETSFIYSRETETEAQFAVDTSSNTVVNEATIVNAWIDAPLIAVMGDVFALSGIVQANALRDHDTGTMAGHGSGMVQNSALIESPTVTLEGTIAPGGGFGGLAIATVEGDLTAYSWLEQINYISDSDVVTITASGSRLTFDSGENLVANVQFLQMLGTGYDMIVVEGDFLQHKWISQTNVLIDDDDVQTVLPALGAGDATPDDADGAGADPAADGGNTLFNMATILGDGDVIVAAGRDVGKAVSGDTVDTEGLAALGLSGEGVKTVLHIKGDLNLIDHVVQKNVVLDNDYVRGIADSVETEGNVLANVATLAGSGMGSTVLAGGDIYSDALIYQAGLIDQTAPEAGVTQAPGLLNEAVAFLADGMIDTSAEIDAAPAPSAPSYDITVPADVMQGVLA